MAITEGQDASKMNYTIWKRDDALAIAASLVVDHSSDVNSERIVKCVDVATGKHLAVGTGVDIVETSDAVTTVTNLTGAVLDVKVTVIVP